MKNMTLANIARACGGQLVNPADPDREAAGVVIDSRRSGAGDLFIATKGEKADGHSFIAQVAANGAIGVVCEKIPKTDIPYILVADSFQALREIALFYRQQLTLPVIGITGSVGKTSTKEFIAGVLGERFRVLKTEGNYNNEVGLPLTVLRIRDEHEVAVLEMGISDFGEMHRLSAIARPDICVITNIGQSHLEKLGSRKGILKAKSEIFDFMAEDGFVCVNGDDDLLAAVGSVNGKKPVCYGLNPANPIFADAIENMGLFGSKAMIQWDKAFPKNQKKNSKEPGILANETLEVMIPLPGEHMVYNALAAVCVGILSGLSKEEMTRGLANLKAMKGRGNIIKLPDAVLIDDCYNANPGSMKAALDLLKLTPGRKVAVLGDMFELGENEKTLHEEVGRYASLCGTDVLVCIGRLSAFMGAAARREGSDNQSGRLPEIYCFPDKESFMEKAGDIFKPGDSILFKASHGMAFEILLDKILDRFAGQTSSLFLK